MIGKRLPETGFEALPLRGQRVLVLAQRRAVVLGDPVKVVSSSNRTR